MLEREVELMTAAGKSGRLPLAQAGRLQELLANVAGQSVTASARELFQKLGDIDEIEPTKKPRSLKATLRPYQEAGLSWLKFIHDIGSGGVLADDMGLGKTVQTIALLLAVRQEEKPMSALIVAPTSVVTNWQRELERFSPTLSVALWHGADRKEQIEEVKRAEVVITSYALLRHEEFLSTLDLTYAILDEAQHIKNPMSATAAARQAPPRPPPPGPHRHPHREPALGDLEHLRLRLAGAPRPARQVRAALQPRHRGRRLQGRAAPPRHHPPLHPPPHQDGGGKGSPGEDRDRPDLRSYRRPEQGLHAGWRARVRAQVLGEVERVGLAKSQLQILAGLTRLRQAACDPRLLGLPRDFTDEDSGKLTALRELVQNAIEGGHKVLVFSQFVMMLKIIEKAMRDDGVTYEYLDGSTKDRAERIDRFQKDPSVPVFLISLKAGGTGLNLTAADTVIHFDPWWNPAVEEQATARAHRIGQSKVVTAYRLVAAGTIEEKIQQLKGKKRELVNSVLSEDQGGSKKLTKADLDELFAID